MKTAHYNLGMKEIPKDQKRNKALEMAAYILSYFIIPVTASIFFAYYFWIFIFKFLLF